MDEELKQLTPEQQRWQGNLCQVQEEFVVQSLGYFFVSYQLTAQVECVDAETFVRERMTSEVNRRAMLRKFDQEYIQPHLKSGTALLVFGWPDIPESAPPSIMVPHLCWHLRNDDGQYHYDPNGSGFLKVINPDEPPILSGAEYKVIMIKQHVTQSQIVESFRMLNDEQIVKARQDPRYAKACQASAIAAMHDHLPVAAETAEMSTTQTHDSKLYSIQVKRSGAQVAIRWMLKKDFHKGDKSVLVGCRTTGGFFGDDLGGSGTRVVQAEQCGQTVDHPGLGETHYYTFAVLRTRQPSIIEQFFTEQDCNPEYETSMVRFSVYVPTDVEVQEEMQLLARFQEGMEDEYAGLQRDIRRKVMTQLGVRKAIQTVYEEELARVDAITDPTQQELEREAVETVIHNLRGDENI